MERRGRIPVAKFRTQEGKTRSRSRVREPDYNEQDPETDLFTLLEDNIALKEENKALKLEIDDHKKSQTELLEDNTKIREQLDEIQLQQRKSEDEIKELSAKYAKTNSERNALDKLHKMKADKINALTTELQTLQEKQLSLSTTVIESIELKNKLLEILPTLNNTDMDSIIDVESNEIPTHITSELVERLLDEYLALKNCMNSVELQLYEANEKISELLENQHHLEEENETLRTENTNLTRVAKLLTENMKESVETSKKMEIALVKLKHRNDELIAKTRDITDGQPAPSPSPTTLKANEEFEQIQEEVHNQNRDHGERIVEMKTIMEAAIQKNTNDELKTLQLKLEILEEELRKALARADHAESELEKCKNLSSYHVRAPVMPTVFVPPPPPPPLPPTLLYNPNQKPLIFKRFGVAEENNATLEANDAFAFTDSIKSSQTKLSSKGSSGTGAGGGGDKIIGNIKQQVQPEAATGIDSLVREFKSGRVTLRRNRRKTQTNLALQEMFQVLEISQKQNRDSKICIDLHI